MADAEEIGRRWFEAIGGQDVDRALEFLSEDVDFRSPAGNMRGRDAVRPFLGGYASAFPDAKFEIAWAVGSGNAAALEGTYAGTNTGSMHTPAGAIPATGRPISLPFATIIETDGERITSHRAYWDQMGLMVQLGLAPQVSGA